MLFIVADVGKVCHGHGTVTVIRSGFGQHDRRIIHIKVSAEEMIALFYACNEGAAAQVRQFQFQRNTVGQLTDYILYQLTITGRAGLKEFVKTVIPFVLHGEELCLTDPFNAEQSQRQIAKGAPDYDTCHQNNGKDRSQNPTQNSIFWFCRCHCLSPFLSDRLRVELYRILLNPSLTER